MDGWMNGDDENVSECFFGHVQCIVSFFRGGFVVAGRAILHRYTCVVYARLCSARCDAMRCGTVPCVC